MSVIEEIYNEKRGFCDRIKPSKAYEKANEKYQQIIQELEKKLNDEQKRVLYDLAFAVGEREGELACTHFKEGFKMGMRLATEAFNKE